MNEKRAYFEELAQQWDELPKPPDAPARLTRFLDALPPRCCGWVLDVGAGTGLLMAPLKERYPWASVVEFDFAHAMLRKAREKHGAETAAVCGDATEPPFSRGAFDLVLCLNVLPHLGEPRRALAALAECVVAGGLLVVGHLMDSKALNAMHASIGGAVGGDRLPEAVALAQMLGAVGLEVERVEERADGYCVVGRRVT
jgi:SAM-dependent methyltransferase